MLHPFLTEAQERGFMHQCTDLEGLSTYLSTPHASFYMGFDATAQSLHVGNLVGVMLCRLAQKHGLSPIILMGGGTTKIGDPSGKTELRQMLTDAKIDKNISYIHSVFQKFLQFGDQPGQARFVNNNDWLTKLNYIDFLRDYGRFFQSTEC